MHYVIYGAGAVGGVIGGRLSLSGRQVTFIARGEHLAAIRQRGLILDTAAGPKTIAAPATDTVADVAWTDDTVVLLCVKSQQLLAVLDDLQAHAPLSTPIFAAQNGVANEAEILRRFPNTYAICVVLPGLHLEAGVVAERAATTPAILDLGRYPAGTDEVAQTVAAELTAAGMVSAAREDIMAWKYRKLINNLGNGVDAVCKDNAAARELIKLAQAEGEAAIAAAGIPIVAAADDSARRREGGLKIRTDVESHSSTWQSVTRGVGNVEIDYLTGEIVLLGRLHGVPTPANDIIQRTVHAVVNSGGAAGSVDASDLIASL